MIIIWGSRSYFRTNQTKHFGFCPHCNQFAKFKSWNGMSFFHLYYFPVIPLQGRMRNHACCNKCNVVQQFRLTEFDATILRYKEESAVALLAIQNGEATFVADNSPGYEIDSLSFLEHAINWLYAANDSDFVRGILEQLRQPNCQYAEAMIQASLATLKGDLEEAIREYKNAAKIEPTFAEPHRRAAQLLVEKRQREQAIKKYLTAISLTLDPDWERSIQLELVEQLMMVKRFPDAEKAYDRLLVLDPSLGHNKAFMKQVSKAKKKAAATHPMQT
jgi:tetratricopeptide (TPR) repeat protein